MKGNDLLLRAISALLGGAFIIGCTMYSPYTFLLAFGGIWVLSLYEFYGLMKKQGHHPPWIVGIGLGLGLFVLSFFIIKGDLAPIWLLSLLPYVLGILLGILLGLFIFQSYFNQTQKPYTTRLMDLGILLLGVIYVTGSGSVAHILLFDDQGYTYHTFLSLIILVWACDSASYVAGRTLGRHKLVARISPNKTWEGLIGGVLGTIGVSIGISFIDTSLSTTQWALIAFVIAITCPLGDILESLLKRAAGVKDSGRIIPGHGGALDRFDGLLVTLAIVPWLIKWLQN